MIVKPGALASMRNAYRMSCTKSSTDGHRHTSRPSSSISVTFPNSRRAAASASFLDIPPSRNSSIFSSRCARISSDNSPNTRRRENNRFIHFMERPFFDLEQIVRRALDVLYQRISVERLMLKLPENDHLQGLEGAPGKRSPGVFFLAPAPTPCAIDY